MHPKIGKGIKKLIVRFMSYGYVYLAIIILLGFGLLLYSLEQNCPVHGKNRKTPHTCETHQHRGHQH